MLELMTAGERQYPDAYLDVRDGARCVVLAGEPRLVYPRGVQPVLGPARAWESLGGAVPLSHTLHGVVENLLDLPSLGEEEAARRLLLHVRTMFAPVLCEHGLPLFHPNRPPFRRTDRAHDFLPCPRAEAVRVDHVVAMASTLLAVQDAAYFLKTQRRPLPKRRQEDLLRWPVLTDPPGDAGRSLATSRLMVDLVIRACLRAAPLMLDVSWLSHRGPSPVTMSRQPVSLYVYDVLHNVDAIPGEDRTYTCSVCGSDFAPPREPQPGEGLYCRQVECQRERKRRNMARSRAKSKTRIGGA
jgi:hypothetical protein